MDIPNMGDEKSGDTWKMEREEKEVTIREQAETIRNLKLELERVKQEKDDLFTKFSALSLTMSSPGDAVTDDAR